MAQTGDFRSAKEKRGGAPTAVEQILTNLLKKRGLDKQIARYKFVMSWKEIVGEEIAKRTRPECIQKGALVVRVCDSAWAQELSFQKHVILKRLKRYLAEGEIVKDLIFSVGGAAEFIELAPASRKFLRP